MLALCEIVREIRKCKRTLNDWLCKMFFKTVQYNFNFFGGRNSRKSGQTNLILKQACLVLFDIFPECDFSQVTFSEKTRKVATDLGLEDPSVVQGRLL